MKKSECKGYVFFSCCLIALFTGYLWTVKYLREWVPEEIRNPLDMATMVIGVLLLLGIFAGMGMAYHRNWKMEKIFLVAYIPMSLMMMFSMPVGRAPDEMAHFERIYLISTGQFFPSGQDNGFDCPVNFDISNAKEFTLEQLYENRNEQLSGEIMRIRSNEATGIYPINGYFPQALLMAVTSLFTKNKFILFYAARFGAWMTTAALLYAAIRKTPQGKEIIIMISLLPMTLQQTTCASVDGVALGTACLLTAYVLEARKNRRPFGHKEYAYMCLLAICIVTFKVMYLPFLFFLYMIPDECFGNRKRKLKDVSLIACAAIFLIVLWMLFCKTKYVDQQKGRLASNILPQLMFVIRSPHRFALTLIRTLSAQMEGYFFDIVGSLLSWFNLIIPSFLRTSILLIFFGSCMTDSDNIHRGDVDSISDRLVRRGLLVLSMICIFIVFLFLYVWYTPYQQPTIVGVQGRYFTPVLYPLLMSLRYKENAQEGLTLSKTKSIAALLALDVCVIAVVVLRVIV